MKLIAYLILIALFILFCIGLVKVCRAEEGTASWYSESSCKEEGTWQKGGGRTASGERFDENDLTCAMRSREFGKLYKVTNLKNGKSVIVRHNDFGPNKKLYNKGRIIDLSAGAFRAIADLKQGIIKVRVDKL